jgi:ActR/RegA family two-component response regulator
MTRSTDWKGYKLAIKLRVLLVEDDVKLSRTIAEILEEAGYDVDTAYTKMEAFEKIRRRTYHAALIDVMLTNDLSDRGGLDVLNFLGEMREGTAAIVISQSPDVHVPVEALTDKGASDYLIKADISSSEDILKPLRMAIGGSNLVLYARLSRLTAYLGRPEKVEIFEYNLMQALSLSLDRLYLALQSVFAPVLPVLRHKAQPAIEIDTLGKSARGLLWSKAVGSAIWVSFGVGAEEPVPPPTDTYPAHEYVTIVGDKGWNGCAKIWRVTRPREEFLETQYEV